MTLHFLIKILTFQFQIIQYQCIRQSTIIIFRGNAFTFFKVQWSLYHIESMEGYRLYTAWVNRGPVLCCLVLWAHTSLKPAALVELFWAPSLRGISPQLWVHWSFSEPVSPLDNRVRFLRWPLVSGQNRPLYRHLHPQSFCFSELCLQSLWTMLSVWAQK